MVETRFENLEASALRAWQPLFEVHFVIVRQLSHFWPLLFIRRAEGLPGFSGFLKWSYWTNTDANDQKKAVSKLQAWKIRHNCSRSLPPGKGASEVKSSAKVQPIAHRSTPRLFFLLLHFSPKSSKKKKVGCDPVTQGIGHRAKEHLGGFVPTGANISGHELIVIALQSPLLG